MTWLLNPWVQSLIGIGIGLWFEHWKGPLATLLRGLTKDQKDAAKNIIKLIPDDPNSVWDDIARAALERLLASNTKVEPEKLNLIRRLLSDVEDKVNGENKPSSR